MVKKILKLFYQEFGGLHRAALVLAASSIMSGLLGLLRDRLLAGTFGAGRELDIYYAAFKIPDFLYIISLSIASVTVLIPFFLEKIDVGQKQGKEFLNNIFTVFLLAMLFLIVAAFFLAPYLAGMVAPGFSAEAKKQLIVLTRILLLSPFLLGLSNLLSTVVQSFRRFFVYALSPILYNIGIIIGILAFFPFFGMNGIAIGVVIGALMHALIQMPSIARLGFLPSARAKINFLEVWQIIKLSLPRALGLGLNQIIFIFITAVASFLGAGSIAVFNLSFNLQSLPLSVIGVSYSVAAFPTLARLFVNNQKRQFLDYTIIATRQIIFWSVPVSILLIVLRAQIVRVLFGYGQFGWRDTRLTAAALALFAFSITSQALIILFVRAFYAAGKTTKPIVINILFFIFIAAGIFLSFNAVDSSLSPMPFFESILRVENVEDAEMLLLPLLFSIGMIFNSIFLCWIFQKDFGKIWPSVKKTFFQVILSSVLMGAVAYFSSNVLDKIFDIKTFVGIFFQGFVSALFGLAVWYAVLRSAGNRELIEITGALKKKFWKEPQVVVPEPEELP
ncbi:murein biosynthesis integral membrane protein MurJ [Patescibacteria group bacterium]|nr:murein biosynthesis integral membrane protein MurJ [Patescibacteria group bacterium]MBU4353683.1 murein biosynthesis integral membrane protein MurJ [Patescibacteria group bacterium]MBU4476962.1 murein biosynthesis integral membrane protein MurJ [Patescibacteria group bacterium]MCG2699026.1 murein biosynthesis integral membrane protein MurJ [Candidatus Parcubacteria bacterium]